MDVNLVMFTPKGKRKDFPLTKSTTVIGRGEKCDLRVPVLSVSRRHCELTLTDDALTIRDLGSSNGTYVDNERISEAELDAGDRLVVGPVVFTVQIDGKPEEIEPTPAGDEEVVDLESSEKAAGKTGITESDIVSALQPEDEEDEDEEGDDAISALEALASEAEEKESEDEEEKQQ
ncbi:MAG: FHA domain-containing protein [Phycisphaerae bacterium]